ncbi:type II toxin-antitoxin system Phd/YefM family antitoxin [Salipiger abyssi]|uniref:Antitoxin n=1 Tax=Salipiger abyssi TaxID=1250539 RepID=A0A1P8UM03_9RHOB|nr:type II toxin-antitoxin system prevent-host-death family antitoxin [Salipiger abyssi]APZ50398.1 prevent-host-death family protein [Salipiger abyssi]
MQFNVHTAKSQLSKLIDAALAGEEVIIAKGARPVVRLVPVAQSGFKLGTQQGKLGALPDFLEPLDEDELDLWEGH